MRDYEAMRDVLGHIARSNRILTFNSFKNVQQRDKVVEELRRLERELLINSTLEFEREVCLGGEVSGLTERGVEFYRLIENDEVWRIVSEALEATNVDISYPLLKEVCEEIVKRYVTSFIPEMQSDK